MEEAYQDRFCASREEWPPAIPKQGRLLYMFNYLFVFNAVIKFILVNSSNKKSAIILWAFSLG